MNDTQLMREIFSAWQGKISDAVAGTLVPAALVAALIANESGGNPNAKRFEPSVFAELSEVLAGKRQFFAPQGISRPLAQADLLPFVVSAESSGLALMSAGVMFSLQKFYTDAMQRVAELATSSSLLQIMGWHWIEFNRRASIRPEDQLAFGAGVLLPYFANKYTLDLSVDAGKLLHCWNTGTPDGHTFDPAYVPRGLFRMELYRSIAGTSQAVSAT